ncbi:protein of unknown function (plasmid) [Cupriavidus taiwanensis]|uniref:Uncharacterized protein n=1 Tax=Cupriavidus taiwanensis TaxID=164546 RepID=A0A375ITR4_9BURK|nr:protein of unknown function [Cupriavidus taiwanensis]
MNSRVGVTTEDVIDPNDIGKEDAIEQPTLKFLGVVHPVLNLAVPARFITGMGPQSLLDMTHAVHVKCVQVDFTTHFYS